MTRPEYRLATVKAFRMGVDLPLVRPGTADPPTAFGICRTVNVMFKRATLHTYDSPSHGPG